MNYLLHLIIYFDIFVILSLSLNLIVGYCGMLSLAHGAFFAIGAYAYAVMTLKYGLGFFPSIAVGVIIAMISSLALSMPAWRLRGDYFVMVSLAVQVLIISLIYNWHNLGDPLGSLKNLTNGPYGVMNIVQPEIFGFEFGSNNLIALLATVTACVCGFILWRLATSPWGRLLMVMRDDELAARSVGKNVRLAKIQALAIGCGLAAVAGGIFASYVGYIEPSIGAIDESVLVVCMVLIGGAGNIRGPVVGTLLLLAIPEILRFVHLPDMVAANVRLLIYGALLVVLVHCRPQGIAGTYRFD